MTESGPSDRFRRRSGATEHDPSARSEAHRDRDRILYSEAFRRLGGVTQVATGGPEQVLHNRLTHSLKVEQVGVSLFSKLDEQSSLGGDADEWAVAAACLAHDLGHPPFGHAGEQTLHELVTCDEHRASPRSLDERRADPCRECKLEDGFEGNAQSFRILTALAVHKDSFKETPPLGLDLTIETLQSVTKYPWARGNQPGKPKKWGAYDADIAVLEEVMGGASQQALGAQLMDWADDISYATHDVEDFYRTGWIPLGDYGPDTLATKEFLEYATAPDAAGPATAKALEAFDNFTTMARQARYTGSPEDIATLDDIRGNLITRFIGASTVQNRLLVVEGTEQQLNAIVKQLMWYHVIESPDLSYIQMGQRRVLSEIFEALSKSAKDAYRAQQGGAQDEHELRRLPQGLRSAIDIALKQHPSSPYDRTQCVYRGVLDYIASLSDADAYRQHRILMGGENAGYLLGRGNPASTSA